MLTQLKQFYYFYETDVINDTSGEQQLTLTYAEID